MGTVFPFFAVLVLLGCTFAICWMNGNMLSFSIKMQSFVLVELFCCLFVSFSSICVSVGLATSQPKNIKYHKTCVNVKWNPRCMCIQYIGCKYLNRVFFHHLVGIRSNANISCHNSFYNEPSKKNFNYIIESCHIKI